MMYSDAIDYLFNQLANYHKSGGAAYKPGLERVNTLLDLLDKPHQKFKSIHVAGTNGKGTVTNAIAAVLSTQGYKTGLFTSPHLVDFRERIRINGECIPEDYVCMFVENYKDNFEHVNASFFEWTWCMACAYFFEMGCDVVLVEVGVGGRLDATNVVVPEISVITSISYDHAAFLGDTLEQIASEKSGIIKQRVPVAVTALAPSVLEVVRAKAEKQESNLYVLQGDYTDWEHENIALARLALRSQNSFEIGKNALEIGLKNYKKINNLRGRWDILQTSPTVIVDTGHNIDAFHKNVMRLMGYERRDMHLILGFAKDKSIDDIISILPARWHYHICPLINARMMAPDQLKNAFEKKNISCSVHEDLKAAYTSLLAQLHEEDVLFIGGSNFLVGEFFEKYF